MIFVWYAINMNNLDKSHQKKYKDGLWIGVGVTFGVVFGSVIDNMGLGIALGVAIGVAVDQVARRKK